MKNTLSGINSRLDKAEDQVSNLEDKLEENTQSEQQKKEFKKMKVLGWPKSYFVFFLYDGCRST